ncbi:MULTISPECIES: DUF2986 domain-containing protein [Shewanella]|uniref:DUF2986 domain-containing protein n=2 Tax=Shewanella TaxID=22 RepID=A0A9X1Z3I9_9GAMM|nr:MULTISPECIES: DUF2986 domain-containing protein [Shewanella]MCL1100084.1 DUF2986 domain-containing protein [Shewanella saliphila]MCL1104475.1 DUF2986 domain-containing protein [Shewanella algicola]GGP39623.1 hypothetical protein GCM10009409_03290 [Shewanella saliphila]GGP43523.1 hypothetical protein GCM10009347_08990 [Shewanella algicola]
MNRKQEMIKKLAKRAKARKNKVVPSNPSSKPVERYISKAEREKIALAAAAEQAAANNDTDTPAEAVVDTPETADKE